LLEKLFADYPHLIGIHCTTSDLGYLARLIELASGRADVHTGGPLLAPVTLALGGQGFRTTSFPKSAPYWQARQWRSLISFSLPASASALTAG
jgi:hypothetical protein